MTAYIETTEGKQTITNIEKIELIIKDQIYTLSPVENRSLQIISGQFLNIRPDNNNCIVLSEWKGE